jgi:hypothetical protein
VNTQPWEKPTTTSAECHAPENRYPVRVTTHATHRTTKKVASQKATLRSSFTRRTGRRL